MKNAAHTKFKGGERGFFLQFGERQMSGQGASYRIERDRGDEAKYKRLGKVRREGRRGGR